MRGENRNLNFLRQRLPEVRLLAFSGFKPGSGEHKGGRAGLGRLVRSLGAPRYHAQFVRNYQLVPKGEWGLPCPLPSCLEDATSQEGGKYAMAEWSY